jgi:hypothetical protein
MAEQSAVSLLLFVLCACLVTMTLVALAAAWELRRVLHRVNQAFPQLERLLQETSESNHQVFKFFSSANRTTRRVQQTVDHACDVADDTLGHLEFVKEGAQALLGAVKGNGAGSGSRRSQRRK